jgi:hypothetical protein
MVPAMSPRPPASFTFSPTRRQPIDDAAYWLDRAEEVQTIAEGMAHPETRAQMLALAHTYKVMYGPTIWMKTARQSG